VSDARCQALSGVHRTDEEASRQHRVQGDGGEDDQALPWYDEEQEEQAVKYKVILRQSEEGFGVSCPGLPGCWSQGKTEEEALANVREAIREYLEARNATVKDEETREVEVFV